MRLLGDKGEGLAVRHLKKKGYRIIKRNFRAPAGEIDIIAEDGGTVVFVEVKTRSDEQFGLPQEAVDGRKRRKIVNAALYFMSSLKAERPARFDIVTVMIRGRRHEVEHMVDAFEGSWEVRPH